MLEEILQFIADDEEVIQGLFDGLDDLKFAQRQAIEDTLDRWLTQQITDENGFLIANALSDGEIDKFEAELLSFYSQDFMNEIFEEMVRRVQIRLETIDDLMRDLELEEALLGEDVFEMEAVNEEIDRIANSFIDAKEGDEEHKGGVDRIRESMQRYRFDRSKSEFTLRNELRNTLRKHTSLGANYTNSIALSSMATIDRKLRRTQAISAGLDHGLYMGPYDDIIRDFCNEWLGKVETWQFWDSLSNDMPEGLFDHPVSIYCGGINCRHRFIGWDLTWSDGEKNLRFQVIEGETYQPSVEDIWNVDLRIEEDHGITMTDKFKEEMGILFGDHADDVHVSIAKTNSNEYSFVKEQINFNKAQFENENVPKDINRISVVHEYAHAMHFKNGVITTRDYPTGDARFHTAQKEFWETARNKIMNHPDFNAGELHIKLRKLKDSLYAETSDAFWNDDIPLFNEKQIAYAESGKIADILASLTNGDFGFGHKKDYWRKVNNSNQMEFFAHMAEMRWARPNQYVDELPMLREVFEEDFDELIERLIEIKQGG